VWDAGSGQETLTLKGQKVAISLNVFLKTIQTVPFAINRECFEKRKRIMSFSDAPRRENS
jgi:hypothetical protein